MRMGKEEGYASEREMGKKTGCVVFVRKGKKAGYNSEKEMGKNKGHSNSHLKGEKGGERCILRKGEKQGAYGYATEEGKEAGKKRGISLFQSTILNHAVPLKD